MTKLETVLQGAPLLRNPRNTMDLDAQDCYQEAALKLWQSQEVWHTKTSLRRQCAWAHKNLLRANELRRANDSNVDVETVASPTMPVLDIIHRQRLWWAAASVLTKHEMDAITAEPGAIRTAAANRRRRLAIRKARNALKSWIEG